MRRTTKALLVAVTVASMFGAARWIAALSVGDLDVEGETGKFQAVLPLSLSSGEKAEEVRVAIGSARDYARLGIERPPIVDQFYVVMGKEARNPVAHIYSRGPVSAYPLDLVMRVSVAEGSVLKRFRVVPPPAGPSRKGEPEATYGPVRRGETLFAIAKRVSKGRFDPRRVSVAIWQRNQDSFIRGNLHGLRRGVVLDLSTLEADVQAISVSEARSIMQSQWAEWKTRKRAAMAAASSKKVEEPIVVVAPPPEDLGPVVEAATTPAETARRIDTATLSPSPSPTSIQAAILAAIAASPPIARSPVVRVASLNELPAAAELRRELAGLKEQFRASGQELTSQLALLQRELSRQANSAELSRQRFARFLYIFFGENVVLLIVLLSLYARKRSREAKRVRARREATVRLLERSLREKAI